MQPTEVAAQSDTASVGFALVEPGSAGVCAFLPVLGAIRVISNGAGGVFDCRCRQR
jgi:hypothetical protein